MSTLRHISKAQSRRLYKYRKARKEYLEEHPVCEVCDHQRATEIHHKKGKLGVLLWDKRFFLATDFECHRRLENNRAAARAKGYLLDRVAESNYRRETL